MYEPLFDYINRYSKLSLTDDEKSIISAVMQPKRLRKRQFFLEEGEVCAYTGFILQGATRQYSIDEEGNEHILQLAIENWWIVDRNSFMNRLPSVYFIEAWEDCELLLLPRAKLETLLAIPAINTMFWQMSENNHIAAQRRLDDTISLSAVKRYENFERMYPQIIQRFPSHQIASYLGIARETLSRARSKSLR